MVNQEVNVIGIGLPRTATTSLAEALQVLGFEGSHKCLIFGKTQTKTSQGKKKFQVDNEYYKIFKEMAHSNPNSKFVLTTRNDSEWCQSIQSYDKVCDWLPTPQMYRREVEDFFRTINFTHNLLILNIFENTSHSNWKALCGFLEQDIPKKNFPFVKNKKEKRND